MVFEFLPHLIYAPILATLVWVVVIGFISWSLVFKTTLFKSFLTTRIDSVLAGMLNVMFVFFMAFTASDVFQGYNAARNALIEESVAIDKLLSIQNGTPEFKSQSNQQIKKYLQNTIDIEWQRDFNKIRNTEADAALSTLLTALGAEKRRCSLFKPPDCLDATTAGSYLKSIDDLKKAREQRLSIGGQGTQVVRYLLCMFLAMNALTGLLLLFIATPRAALPPLIMYCFSLWIILMMVVMHSNPYAGVKAIEPAPLGRILQNL